MSGGRNAGGGSDGGLTNFTAAEGVLTYKRRKRGLGQMGSDLQGDPSVSSGGQKAVEEPRVAVVCNGMEEGGLARIQRHWKIVLEQLLVSQDASDDGIWGCIQKTHVSRCFSSIHKLSAYAAQIKHHESNGSLRDETKGVDSHLNAEKQTDIASCELKRDTSGQEDARVISKKCQDTLIEVLASEKFALLCDLLLGNFPGIKADSIIDLNLINSKMQNGAYGLSIGLLHQDLQQVWERIQRIGQKIALLAAGLLNISQPSFERQKPSRVGTEEKNSMDSRTATQFPCESDRSTKPEQTEACCLYKVSVCKECGSEADGKSSLICDGCEAIYHFSCVMSAAHGIPTHNWYCSACTRGKRESAEPKEIHTHQDKPHKSCIVCDRLKASGMISGENATTNESHEGSVSSMDSESPEPSRTATLGLCKMCGTYEDPDKRFITCDHSLCPFKYYHIRCLTSKQLAIMQQKELGCWYCPSCLCRGCFTDKDDDKIVMCDGCDEGYHTYCMKPPRTSVPKGKWYCIPCNILRAKQGMEKYELWVLRQVEQSDKAWSNQSNRSMHLLASAVEKVESLTAARKNR